MPDNNYLVCKHLEYIRRVLYQFKNKKASWMSEQDIDDITQNVVEIILRGAFDNFRGECSETTYIFKIVHNTAFGYIRKNKRYLDTPGSGYIDIVAEPTRSQEKVVEKIELEEKLQAVAEIIASMSPVKQLIYKMHFEDDLTQEQVAQSLRLAQSTVSEHWNNIIRELRSDMVKKFPDN